MAEAPQSSYSPQWGAWTRQLMTIFLIIAGLFALTLLSPVVQVLTLAFLLTFALYIPTRSLNRRVHFPWAMSVIVVYTMLILAIIIGILLVIPAAVNGVESLSTNLAEGVGRFENEIQPYLQDGLNTVEVFGVQVDIQFLMDPVRQALGALSQINETSPNVETPAPSTADPPADEATGTTTVISATDVRNLINSLLSIAGTLTETLTSAITGITTLFTSLLLAVLISFFLLLDVPTLSRSIERWIPDIYSREYILLNHKIIRVWNGFFRGQVIIGVMIGILTWIQLQMMGIPSAPLLAVITGTISLIPTIGGFFALIPLGLVPLLNGSTVFPDIPNGFMALFVILVNVFITQVIWNVIAPKILGDVLDLPLVLIIVGVFIGAAVGGILGAFLVAPIMGTIRILVLYIIAKIALRDPFPGEEVPSPPVHSRTRRRNRVEPPIEADPTHEDELPTAAQSL
ncbi:MAG: AI-2E family transporter [bacterium]|nr:AI-2E family transporter [bacterium]